MKNTFLGFLFFGSSLFAAVPEQNNSLVTEALKLPTEVRLETLSRLGPKGYKELVDIAFDSNNGLKLQWRALSSIALIGKAQSMPELEKALASKQWYLRNVGLVMLKEVKPDAAKKWAKKLLSDASLIVRTDAVKTLHEIKDVSSKELLWKKLYDKQNFRGKESLWIRKYIVDALLDFKQTGDEARFIKLLDDHDAQIPPRAITALEELTKQKMGSPQDSIVKKSRQWKSWWAKNNVKAKT